MNMQRNQLLRQAIRVVARDPGLLPVGIWGFGHAWIHTRNWWQVVRYGWPIVLVVFGVCLAAYGRTTRDSLLSEYLQKIEELESEPSVKEQKARSDFSSLLGAKPMPQEIEVLLTRVLQLDRSPQRATYLIAKQMAESDRLAQARFMMRKIAPEEQRGYPPAYAWLAADRLLRLGLTTPRDKSVVMNDLEQVLDSGVTTPQFADVYAQLLVSEGRQREALSVLQKAEKTSLQLLVRLAGLAKDLRETAVFQQATSDAENLLEPSLETLSASEQDYAAAAGLALLQEQWQKATRFASAGLKLNANNPLLRRILSDALHALFMASQTEGAPDFQLLDAAMRADGANPAVAESLFKLQEQEQDIPKGLEGELLKSLDDGRSNGLAHLYLGNKAYASGKLRAAQGHLEIASQLAPNSVAILNNLAMILTQLYPGDEEQLNRAQALVRRALRLQPASAELHDSLGVILAQGERWTECVESLERALSLDPERRSTRKKLIEAYRAKGLEELAERQEKILADQESTD